MNALNVPVVETRDLVIPGEITATGWALPDGLSYEQWVRAGATLKLAQRSVLWWIGDWLNFGERKWGEKYAEALEATDYEYETLRAAQWVAGKFETVRRRTDLSWSHHKEVAALPPAEADRLLHE